MHTREATYQFVILQNPFNDLSFYILITVFNRQTLNEYEVTYQGLLVCIVLSSTQNITYSAQMIYCVLLYCYSL